METPVNYLSSIAVPSPPTAPLEVRAVGLSTCVLEWGAPESDGGAPLEGYNIAIRDLKRTMWIEVGRVPADVQKFNVRDLVEDHEYAIRVFARNEVGLSEPLELFEPYKVIPGQGIYRILYLLTDTGLNSYFFIFIHRIGQDLIDDGEPKTDRTGFSTENTSSWLREHHMDADIKSYARAKLLRKDEYFFRIFHTNPKLFKKSKK